MRLMQKPLLRAHPAAAEVPELGGSGSRPVPARDPANDLYDRACELLLAAHGLRSAAGERGSATAFAATVGCIDASLEALADAVAAMRRETAREVRLARAVDEPLPDNEAKDAAREFSSLADALTRAHDAAGRMRERLGPFLARLTLP